jgi:hypothetical protein
MPGPLARAAATFWFLMVFDHRVSILPNQDGWHRLPGAQIGRSAAPEDEELVEYDMGALIKTNKVDSVSPATQRLLDLSRRFCSEQLCTPMGMIPAGLASVARSTSSNRNA